MADTVNQDAVHKDGTDHIKEQVFGSGQDGQGTTSAVTENTKPEPITAPKPPASNPGADDPSAGIAKDAGGLSVAAHVESPTATNKEKRKSIVGTLKGFLGFDKKEREVSEAGTAKQGDVTTGEIAAGATGVALGDTVTLPDRTKATSTQDISGSAQKSTTEQIKDATLGSKEANPLAAAATTTSTEPTETAKQETTDTKMSESQPTDTSGDSADKPPVPAGGKPPENRDAIPVAGGERLGDKHWGESKIVPDNPKKQEESSTGVASAEGQPTEEVVDNTAKNTGGASAGPGAGGDSTPQSGEKKGKFIDKVKDKLPFGKKDKE